MEFAVVISSHGRRKVLAEALGSVRRLEPSPRRVIVLANGDADGTLPFLLELQREFPVPLEVLYWPVNQGSIPGWNAVFERALAGPDDEAVDPSDAYYEGFDGWRTLKGGEPDIWPDPRPTVFLPPKNPSPNPEPCEALFQIDDDALFLQGDSLAIAENHFADYPQCGVIQARLLEEGRADEGEEPYLRATYVGAGIAVRREAWMAARPYPGWFFRNGEETVGAIRMMAKGWQIHYLPELRVEHRAVPAARPSIHFHGYSMRNVYLLAAMFQPAWLWPIYWPAHFVRTCWRRITGRQPSSPLAALVGALRLLPRALRSRRPEFARGWREHRRLARGRVSLLGGRPESCVDDGNERPGTAA